MTRRPAPSTEPVVPISAKRNWMTCSGWGGVNGKREGRKGERTCLCIFLHMSVTFAKMDFLFPSRKSWGGAMVYRFREDVERRAGLAACREA